MQELEPAESRDTCMRVDYVKAFVLCLAYSCCDFAAVS